MRKKIRCYNCNESKNITKCGKCIFYYCDKHKGATICNMKECNQCFRLNFDYWHKNTIKMLDNARNFDHNPNICKIFRFDDASERLYNYGLQQLDEFNFDNFEFDEDVEKTIKRYIDKHASFIHQVSIPGDLHIFTKEDFKPIFWGYDFKDESKILKGKSCRIDILPEFTKEDFKESKIGRIGQDFEPTNNNFEKEYCGIESIWAPHKDKIRLCENDKPQDTMRSST